MALTVEFKIHSVNMIPVPLVVEHEGAPLNVIADCCEVELVDDKGQSLTLRFTGKDCVEARGRFKADDTLSWSL